MCVLKMSGFLNFFFFETISKKKNDKKCCAKYKKIVERPSPPPVFSPKKFFSKKSKMGITSPSNIFLKISFFLPRKVKNKIKHDFSSSSPPLLILLG